MPRKRKQKPAEKPVQPSASQHKPAQADVTPKDRFAGRVASEVRTESVAWLWHPFIPVGMLTLIVGIPSVGKSTFLASLIAHATGDISLEDRVRRNPGRAVLLTGQEEDVHVMTVPRLLAAGVDLDDVLLQESSDIALIRDKHRLSQVCKDFNATLLIADPIDNYMDEGLSEDNGQHMRSFLEAAVWIAKQAGVAFVGARHPGKDIANICPGSRQWRAVPRSVVQLTNDGSYPPQYHLSHYKDSLGTRSQPVRYELVGEDHTPKRFKVIGEVNWSVEELHKSAGGPSGRWKLMAACRLIRWLFEQEDHPTRQQCGEEARKQGIGEDTVNEALRLLAIRSLPGVERAMPWRLHRTLDQWPEWLPQVHEGGGSPDIS